MTGQELYERLAAGYDYDPMYAEVITERDKLRAENVKLRKACTDAYRAICKMYVRIDGEWNYGDAHADPTYGPILRRMRELGIEVEDA